MWRGGPGCQVVVEVLLNIDEHRLSLDIKEMFVDFYYLTQVFYGISYLRVISECVARLSSKSV